MVAFRPDSLGLWYYKVSKMWSVIILVPKIFGLWCSGRPFVGGAVLGTILLGIESAPLLSEDEVAYDGDDSPVMTYR